MALLVRGGNGFKGPVEIPRLAGGKQSDGFGEELLTYIPEAFDVDGSYGNHPKAPVAGGVG
jgi:hypothetical protein